MIYTKRMSCLLFLVILVATTKCDCGIDPKPIHEAIESNDIDKVKLIIESGEDINVTDGRGRTPLYYAAWFGRKEIAEYLISKGADMTKGASWKGDNTPLHEAAEYGHINIVKLLLDKGVDPNIRNYPGQTPLMFAIDECYPEIVKLLIKYGANINAKEKNGRAPLGRWWLVGRSSKSIESYRETLKVLMNSGLDVNAKCDEDNGVIVTPLLVACNIGDIEMVKMLVLAGADVNAENPLAYAKDKGLKEIADFLIQHGAK